MLDRVSVLMMKKGLPKKRVGIMPRSLYSKTGEAASKFSQEKQLQYDPNR